MHGGVMLYQSLFPFLISHFQLASPKVHVFRSHSYSPDHRLIQSEGQWKRFQGVFSYPAAQAGGLCKGQGLIPSLCSPWENKMLP